MFALNVFVQVCIFAIVESVEESMKVNKKKKKMYIYICICMYV